MSRPEVSVVMPFAGDGAGAAVAADALVLLDREEGDELILVDNSGVIGEDFGERWGVRIVPAPGERSPAHARNVGARQAGREWILFIDADCRPCEGLLAAYFGERIDDRVGAVVGEVLAAAGGDSLVARYGAARSFLGQAAHLDHPYRPRAAAANLLVRREAFDQVGGFYEGVRAAEDTDFSWRLQQAGWRLEPRPEARVEHRYRETLAELRRQWRGYAAGRAWLARRYQGFEPEPALARRLGRAGVRMRARMPGAGAVVAAQPRGAPAAAGRLERGGFLALDALLGLEELAGLALSNRPAGGRRDTHGGAVEVVLVADRFPAQGDPLVELAGTLERARVEALARPEAVDLELARGLDVDYVEDDGVARRVSALAALLIRHPLRCAGDLARRRSSAPTLLALAPAAERLERDGDARVHALGGEDSRVLAVRIARLAGHSLDR